MELTLSEIAAATGGELFGDAAATVLGASIDSRTVKSGPLFVPIVAERDGHDFVDSAINAGARAVLIDANHRDLAAALDVPVVIVASTNRALADLAQHAAARLRSRGVDIVGITGSVGKTSVKDLAAAALSSRRVHASERSFNNELGVPLTVLNAPDDAAVLLVEMGARGPGHIEWLCEIAQPNAGVITMIAAAHTSEFGSIDGVIEAKGELFASLPEDGTAILNIDAPGATALQERANCRVIGYGESGQISADDIVVDDQLRARFTARWADDSAPVRLSVAGAHQVANTLGALGVAVAVAGLPLTTAARDVGGASLSPWRMEMGSTATGATVINDAYNANTASVRAALDALAAVDAKRRIAVLGTMAELGDRHDVDHQAMAEHARDLGIRILAFDEDAYGVTGVATIDDAVMELGILGPGDAVLIKGSRVAGLERLAHRLIDG